MTYIPRKVCSVDTHGVLVSAAYASPYEVDAAPQIDGNASNAFRKASSPASLELKGSAICTVYNPLRIRLVASFTRLHHPRSSTVKLQYALGTVACRRSRPSFSLFLRFGSA